MKKLCALITVCLLATSVCLAGGKYEVLRSVGYTSGRPTLTNFPMLVVLGTNISGFSYSQFASTNGWDLRFYTSSGTELNYEIESWGCVGDSNSYIWVQVPQLTYNGQIRAAWGDASKTQQAYTTNGATWDSDFKGVWHLPNGITLSTLDSTTNRNDGTAYDSSAITGQVDGAIELNGSSSYMDAASPSSLDNLSQKTLSFWTKLDAQTGTGTGSHWMNKGSSFGWLLGTDPSNTRNIFGAAFSLTNGRWSFPQFSTAVFHHVGLFYDNTSVGNNPVILVDGVPQLVTTYLVPVGTASNDDSYALLFSKDASTDRWVDGVMDEIRISSSIRSTNWIWAEWYNMVSNTSFVSYGALQNNSMRVYTNHSLVTGATIYGTNSVLVDVSKAAEAGGPPYVYNFGNAGSGFVGALNLQSTKMSGTNLVFDMGFHTLSGSSTNFFLTGNSLVISNVANISLGTADTSASGSGGDVALGSSFVRVSNNVSMTGVSTYSSSGSGLYKGGNVDIYALGFVSFTGDIDTHTATTNSGANGYAGKVTINHQGSLTIQDILSYSSAFGDGSWAVADMTLTGDGVTPGTLTGVLTARNLNTRYLQNGIRAPGRITISGYTGANISGTVRSSSAGSSNGGDITITNIAEYIKIAGAITANSVAGTDGLLNMQTLGSASVGALDLSTVSSALFNAGSQSFILGLLSGTAGTPATGLADIGTSLRTPAGQTIRYVSMKNPALSSQTLTLADLGGVAGAGGLLTPADTMFVQTNQDLSSFPPIYGTNSSGASVAKGLTSSVYDFGSVVTGFVGHLNLGASRLSRVSNATYILMNMGGHNIEGTGTNFYTFRGAGAYVTSAGLTINNVGTISIGKVDLHQEQTQQPTFSELPAGSLTIGEPTGTGNGPAMGSVQISEINCSALYGDGGNVTIYSASNVLIQTSAGVPGTISTRFSMICNWSDKAGDVLIRHTGSFVVSNIWANCYNGSFRYPQGGNVTLQGNYGGAVSGSCTVYDILSHNGLVDGGASGNINIGGYSSFTAHNLWSLSKSDIWQDQAGYISITNIAGNINITGTIDAGDAMVPARSGIVRLQTSNGGHIMVANLTLNKALYTTVNPSGKAYITGTLYSSGTTLATPASIGTTLRAPVGKVIYYVGNKSPGLGYRTIRLANEAGTAGAGGLLTPAVNTQTPEYQSILGERTQL